jgi:purine nucleoside phosphorylase
MGSTLPFDATLRAIYELVPKHLAQPRVGIVCGSGLSTLAESLKDVVLVPYEKLEGFGASTGGFGSSGQGTELDAHGNRKLEARN